MEHVHHDVRACAHTHFCALSFSLLFRVLSLMHHEQSLSAVQEVLKEGKGFIPETRADSNFSVAKTQSRSRRPGP